MPSRKIQLYRNSSLYSSKEEAKNALKTMLSNKTLDDGMPVLARYGTDNNYKCIMGIPSTISGDSITILSEEEKISDLDVQSSGTSATTLPIDFNHDVFLYVYSGTGNGVNFSITAPDTGNMTDKMITAVIINSASTAITVASPSTFNDNDGGSYQVLDGVDYNIVQSGDSAEFSFMFLKDMKYVRIVGNVL